MSNHIEKDDDKNDDPYNPSSSGLSPRSTSKTGMTNVARIKSWGRNVAVRTLSPDDASNGSGHNDSNQLERANSRQRNERPAVWTRGRKAGTDVDGLRFETEEGSTSPQAEHLQAQVRFLSNSTVNCS